MNVTLIYSLLAYSSIKQRDFSGVYVSLSLDTVCLLSHYMSIHFLLCCVCLFVCLCIEVLVCFESRE